MPWHVHSSSFHLCRAERSSGVFQLALERPREVEGPLQKSRRYRVTAEYIEQRPSQASFLQGSASSRIEASSHIPFEVRSGAPVSMQLLNPKQEVAGLNAANLNDRWAYLLQFLCLLCDFLNMCLFLLLSSGAQKHSFLYSKHSRPFEMENQWCMYVSG